MQTPAETVGAPNPPFVAAGYAELDDFDMATLWNLLLGGQTVPSDRDPQGASFAPWSAGLLRRLAQAFMGDPVGPAQNITVGGVAVGLVVPDAANMATAAVEAAPIRYRTDGTLPTGTAGTQIALGAKILITGRATLKAFQMLSPSGGSIVNVDYYT